MARIRSVHPGFFTDENVVEATFPARMLLIGLGVEADDKGVFPWKPTTLKMRIFPADNIDVEPLLDELVTNELVLHFKAEGKCYGAIRNFRKHQKPKSPNDIYPISDEATEFVGLGGTTKKRPITETGDDKPCSFPPKGEKPPQMEDGGGKDSSSEPNGSSEGLSESVPTPAPKPKKSKRETYPKDFEQFWTDYPTDALMSKKEACTAWKRLSQPDRELAIKSVPAFRAYCQAETDYRPVHACRYLSQRRFEGFAEVASKNEARIFVEAGTSEWTRAVEKFEKVNGRRPTPTDHKGKRGWWFPKAWFEMEDS